MKKNIKKALDKVPLITIAISVDRNITYYNNFAKQKFLFIEEGRDINAVIRSMELNSFIDKAFRAMHWRVVGQVVMAVQLC